MKIVNFDKKGIQIIVKGLYKPIGHAAPFFKILGNKVRQATDLTFRVLGKRDNHKAWVGYNRGKGHVLGGSTRTKKGTWRIRYGTDLKGRSGMQGVPRKVGRNDRYSPMSVMLQKSGGFRNSFNILKVTDKSMKFGSRKKIAAQIMSDPDRPVLFVTNNDKKSWTILFKKFVNKGIKF